jgi:hypothetical protein
MPASPRTLAFATLTVIVGLTQSSGLANPEPDIPVRCHFDKDGSCTITAEIDPRCFTASPMRERYRMKADLDYDSAADLQKWKDLAADAVKRWLVFLFDPSPPLKPAFTFAFTGQNEAAMVKPDDPLVVTATWRFKRPAGMKALQIQATKEARFSVVVRHFRDGVEQKRFATLFPGETSFTMEVP